MIKLLWKNPDNFLLFWDYIHVDILCCMPFNPYFSELYIPPLFLLKTFHLLQIHVISFLIRSIATPPLPPNPIIFFRVAYTMLFWIFFLRFRAANQPPSLPTLQTVHPICTQPWSFLLFISVLLIQAHAYIFSRFTSPSFFLGWFT